MISHLDHLVLTVRDIEKTVAFYTSVLGMKEVTSKRRRALAFGYQKINLHEAGREYDPKADKPTPGSADLCFIAEIPLAAFCRHLEEPDIRIIEGPVARTGARGGIISLYFRDPDENLLEVSNYLAPGET
ncbi:VOC family protein [soil metagenome]